MLTSTVSPLLRIGLSLIGVWPGASHATPRWLFYMTTLAVMQYFQYYSVYVHLDFSNLSKLMDGLGLTLAYTQTTLKILSLWLNRRIFADILEAMNDDWKDCETKLRECVMIDKANLAHRCSNAMISINILSTFLYFIDKYIRGHRVSKNGQLFREFSIQIQFPFDVYKRPVYELVNVGLFFHVFVTGVVMAMLNALILTLVLHVSGQIDIMCQELREIPSTLKSSSVSTKTLVGRHQKIISVSKYIEDLFTYVSLLQFVWNTLVICALGFMVVISLGNMTSNSGVLTQCIIPYLAVTMEAFVLCFAGDYLSTKSKAIGDAAYEVVWYDLSTSECRSLLFVILRSQKQLTITAGKVVDLTLESFITVMKASASYVSVLYALY
ncbi:PREDICTED: odorant receptor 67c-like [Vollenhovia emeryi]|uniref:odorant receptor 67c-like n=1 Tax=Vollenhovia emeryi TaxID=411798 RepID=UPI0005F46ABC|nr:PREDICTED: odorant receptor 67c-like [Vollenhovia emeryi]